MTKALRRSNLIVGGALGAFALIVWGPFDLLGRSFYSLYFWIVDYLSTIALMVFGAAFFGKVFIRKAAILPVLFIGTFIVVSVSIYVGFWVYDGRGLWMKVFQ